MYYAEGDVARPFTSEASSVRLSRWSGMCQQSMTSEGEDNEEEAQSEEEADGAKASEKMARQESTTGQTVQDGESQGESESCLFLSLSVEA